MTAPEIPDEIMREARELCQPSCSGGTRIDDAQHIVDVARALLARDQRAAEIAKECGHDAIKFMNDRIGGYSVDFDRFRDGCNAVAERILTYDKEQS